MAGRWTAYGGWTIEVIRLDHRDCYRVTRRGYLVGDGYCYSHAELIALLAAYNVDIGDLVEDDTDRE